MTQPELEKEAEREVLAALRKAGLQAWHMDTTIDGFPDILVLGGYSAMIEMKYDRSHRRIKLFELMEASQPVFAHEAQKAGFSSIFLCVFDGESYTVYDTDGILERSMAGDTLACLSMRITHAGPEAVADFIKEQCDAC